MESRSSEPLLRNWTSDVGAFSTFIGFESRQIGSSPPLFHLAGSWLVTTVSSDRSCSPRWVSKWNAAPCFLHDDTRTRLTPCVDARTWKGEPTGVAMAAGGRLVGVTNSLNGNCKTSFNLLMTWRGPVLTARLCSVDVPVSSSKHRCPTKVCFCWCRSCVNDQSGRDEFQSIPPQSENQWLNGIFSDLDVLNFVTFPPQAGSLILVRFAGFFRAPRCSWLHRRPMAGKQTPDVDWARAHLKRF